MSFHEGTVFVDTRDQQIKRLRDMLRYLYQKCQHLQITPSRDFHDEEQMDEIRKELNL